MAKSRSKGLAFNKEIDEEILSKLGVWEQGVFDVVSSSRPDLADQLRYRSTVPLELLPIEARRKAMSEFKSIVGFNTVIQKAAGGHLRGTAKEVANRVLSGGLWTSHRAGERGYGSFRISNRDDSVLGHLYRQMNVQFRTPYDGRMTGMDYFSFGTESIPTTSALRNGRQGIRPMLAGSKFTVFDLETGGLSFGQIRELSYASGAVGPGGSLSLSSQTTRHMRSSAFARGMLAYKGKMLSMEGFMSSKYGINYSGMGFGDGEDFINKTMPFLRQITDSDYILGHNISRFDIQQLFVGLSGTSAYKNNKAVNGVNFREFVDSAYKHLDGRIVDTQVMAKQAKNLSSITTAPELLLRGSTEKYSIANLILQTDLLQRAPELQALINNGAGLHLGDVDAAVTARLAELIPSLRTIGDASIGSGAFRAGVAKAAAILPITNIRDVSEIGDDLLRHMILNPGSGIGTTNPALQRMLSSARGGGRFRSNVGEIMRAIRSGKYDASFDVNALEQEVFYTRNLNMQSGLVDRDSRLLGMGSFSRLTGKDRRYSGVEKTRFGRMNRTSSEVTQAQYSTWQVGAQARGIPYAGLSFEERRLGTSLAGITSNLAVGAKQKMIASMGIDSLISHFRSYGSIYHNINNPNVGLGLPAAIIDYLDDTSQKMVSFSPYKYASSEGVDKYGVNVVYKFGSMKDAGIAADRLEELVKKSDDEIASVLGHSLDTPVGRRAVADFKKNSHFAVDRLRSQSILKEGVSIAKVDSSSVAKRIFNLMGDFFGVSNLDDATMKVRSQIVDVNNGVLRVGAPIVDKFLDPTGMAALAARTEEARRYLDDFVADIPKNARDLRSARQILKAGSDASLEKVLSVNDKYFALRPKMKKAVGLAGIATLGYYLNRKRKENELLNEPLTQMPYEVGSSYYLQEQIELKRAMGETGAKYMDPLATAQITGNLFDNRVNHSDMTWDKNSALFGGVI